MRSVLIGLAAGVVGVLLALLALHVWTDHLLVHEMNTFLLQHAAAISKLP